jgi:hypothetical protein
MNPTELESAPPKLDRSRYQYTLRSLMLFVLIWSLLCSAIAVWMQRERRHLRAKEAILFDMAGHIEYSDKSVWDREKAAWYSRHERGAEGRWDLRYERAMGARGLRMGEFDCPVLADGFEIRLHAATDERFAKADLTILSPLRTLSLQHTEVTDAGLVCLQDLTQLRALDLDFTQVTDAGLKNLQGLHELQWLSLAGIRVTDAGFAHLERLSRLEWLNLRNTAVTDAELAHLKGWTQLEWLDLQGTEVTDAGLVHLKGMTKLQHLNLRGTKVSFRGIYEFERALPHCEILRDGRPTNDGKGVRTR